MDYESYLTISINNLNDNINYLKSIYNYQYYILDISNNAYNHGFQIINYIDNIDYLYVNNLYDLLNAKKIKQNIPIIYGGSINKNNIDDLIVNNAILLIKDINIIKNIKDKINIILDIDKYNGIYTKNTILELNNLNNNIHILGLISNVNKDNYEDYKYITSSLKNLELICLNNELDKNKIKHSNTIKLNYSILGFNLKKQLKKEILPLKQVLSLNTKIIKTEKNIKKKKDIYIGVIPLGYLNGFPFKINKVIINNKLYNIIKIEEEYSLIAIDKDININDIVIITNKDNPLEKYYQDNILITLKIFNNLPIIYENDKEIAYTY